MSADTTTTGRPAAPRDERPVAVGITDLEVTFATDGGDFFLEGTTVEQAGEAVGRRLQLRLVHDPEQPDAGARQLCQRAQILHPVSRKPGVGPAGGVNDAHGAAHDGDRNANRGHGARRPAAKFWAGIQIIAVVE